jgi:hypothetical protein
MQRSSSLNELVLFGCELACPCLFSAYIPLACRFCMYSAGGLYTYSRISVITPFRSALDYNDRDFEFRSQHWCEWYSAKCRSAMIYLIMKEDIASTFVPSLYVFVYLPFFIVPLFVSFFLLFLFSFFQLFLVYLIYSLFFLTSFIIYLFILPLFMFFHILFRSCYSDLSSFIHSFRLFPCSVSSFFPYTAYCFCISFSSSFVSFLFFFLTFLIYIISFFMYYFLVFLIRLPRCFLIFPSLLPFTWTWPSVPFASVVNQLKLSVAASLRRHVSGPQCGAALLICNMPLTNIRERHNGDLSHSFWHFPRDRRCGMSMHTRRALFLTPHSVGSQKQSSRVRLNDDDTRDGSFGKRQLAWSAEPLMRRMNDHEWLVGTDLKPVGLHMFSKPFFVLLFPRDHWSPC